MRQLAVADIVAAGLVTPVGLTARTALATLRAGLPRLRETPLRDSQLRPLVAGFLDDAYLPALAPPLAEAMRPMTTRHRRMVLLAAGALQEAAAGCEQPLPLLLALPEPLPWGDPVGPHFLRHLQTQSGVRLEPGTSQVLRQGRAGGLVAVERALELLATDRARQVLVGGVDTYWDALLLAHLDAEERLRVQERLTDGFTPGEGACFLRLSTPTEAARRAQAPLARIASVGTGREPGHRYSQQPYLGEGLAQAFRHLFERLPSSFPKVRHVQAGLNGEGFWAKEWGVAYLRHSQRFESTFNVEHPAEYTGDMGAALGPLLVAQAAEGLKRGYRQGPCLAWASSDREERAAVMIQAATPQGGTS